MINHQEYVNLFIHYNNKYKTFKSRCTLRNYRCIKLNIFISIETSLWSGLSDDKLCIRFRHRFGGFNYILKWPRDEDTYNSIIKDHKMTYKEAGVITIGHEAELICSLMESILSSNDEHFSIKYSIK